MEDLKSERLFEEIRQGLERIIDVDMTERLRFHKREEPDMKSPEEREGIPTPKEIAADLLARIKTSVEGE